MANEANAQPATLQMVVEIKRAATGKTETYTLTGTPIAQEQQPEPEDGSHAHHDATQ